MSKLVLIGGGGHCKSVIDTVRRMNIFDKIVIVDPQIDPGTLIMGCEVVGSDDCLKQLYKDGFNQAFITVGSVRINPLREKLVRESAIIGFSYPKIIDPSAIVSDSAIIGDGTFIGKNVCIHAESVIGKHCIINTGAIIEHECEVGDYTHVSVGTILCGEVHVGSNCMIGAGSTVIQCNIIGDNVVIGANSTVLSNVCSDMKCFGVIKL